MSEALIEAVGAIALHRERLQRYVDIHFEGNLAAFGRSMVTPVHRSTIVRWFAEPRPPLPKSTRRLLDLAETLDLDPFLLLDFSPETFQTLCSQSTWITRWGRYNKALTFLSDLVGLSDDHWPLLESEDAEWEWHTWDLEHLARDPNNYFFPLEIASEVYFDLTEDGGELQDRQRTQQVWYIAVRDARSEGDQLIGHGVWKPFGIFFTDAGCLNLLNLGTGQWLRQPLSEERFGIEFYCGPGSAIFRVASLHPFEADTPIAPETPTLRYVFPE